MAARWKREPRETGLRAVTQVARGYELWDGDECLAHIDPIVDRFGTWKIKGWIWYGFGVNTAAQGRKFLTAEDAKADCNAYRKKLAKEPTHD